MADFDLVEYGYNAADETVNFGTRCLSAGDSLFEVVTVASMKCSQHHESRDNVPPKVKSEIVKGRLFISVNNTFRAVKEREEFGILCNISFDAVIDTFSVSRNGDYVLVGLRDGNVCLVDCNDEFACVFSSCLSKDVCGPGHFIDCFLEVENEKSTAFLIVSQKGAVYRIGFDNGLGKEIKVEVGKISDLATEITQVCPNYPLVFLRGQSRNFVLNLNDHKVISELNYINLKKIFSFDYCTFFALEEDSGELVEICGSSLLTFPVNDCPNRYDDVLFFNQSNSRYLIAITKEDEIARERFLQILSYPSFEVTASLAIADEIMLIAPESINDELLFISRLKSDDIIRELRLHMVCETEPEQRLLRLVKKQKFAEAEKFADIFKLNPDVIKMAKAQLIVDQDVCDSKDVDSLVGLLEEIAGEFEFKLNCCLNVEPGDFEDVQRVLSYGCSLAPKIKQVDNSLIVDALQKELSRLMFRSDTFLSLSRISDYKTPQWSAFSHCDLIEQIKAYLKNHEIDEAIIVYSHLDETCIDSLTQEKIKEVIRVLDRVPYATFRPFLTVFVHVTLANLPTTLSLFVDWTFEKVSHFELKNKAHFPENAIEVVINMAQLLRHSEIESFLLDSSWSKLHELFGFLRQLKQLKDEYGIGVPLRDYLTGPKAVVRQLLNIQMSPEGYKTLLKEFLSNFMIENNLNLNEIFLTEITNIMKNYEESYWIKIVGSILDCITSVETKTDAILVILGGAKVPWTDKVRQIAFDSLKYSHSNVKIIKEKIQDEPISVVLKKPIYKIKESRIADVDDLKFFVNRIIYCNDENMIEDVYTISEKTTTYRHEACKLLMRHFIKKGEIQQTLAVLDKNDDREVKKLSEEFLGEAEVFINSSRCLPNLKENYENILGALNRRLGTESHDSFALECQTERVDRIKAVYKLSKHYGNNLTTHDLVTPNRKWLISESLLDSIIDDYSKKVLDMEGLIEECEKLSHGLLVDKEEVLLKLCAKVPEFDLILEIARRFNSISTSCRNLCLISVLILRNVGTCNLRFEDVGEGSVDDTFVLPNVEVPDHNLFARGMELARENVSKAISYAKSDEIGACMATVNWINVTMLSNLNKNENGAQNLLFGEIHGDDGIFGYSTVTGVRTVFNLYCDFIGQFRNPDLRYLTYFCDKSNAKSLQDFLLGIKMLPITVDDLIKEGQHFTAYNLMKVLSMSMCHYPDKNGEICQILTKIMTNCCVPKIIQTTFANPNVDSNLIYNLLLLSSKEVIERTVLNNLKFYRREPKKFSTISQIGIRLWRHLGITHYLDKLINAKLTVKWWEKLKNAEFRYDSFFKMSAQQRFEFIAGANLPNFTVQTVQEYCNDFGLKLQLCYVVYLKSTLSSWRPRFQIVDDLMDGGKLVIQNDESEILKKCRKIVDVIEDKANILDVVNSIWSSTNFYYYETFLAILALTSDLNVKADTEDKRKMLSFLRNYQRVKKPSQMEIEQWFSSFPDTQSVDPLSEFRLPFTPSLFTPEIWNIIRQEINLKTYKFWFESIDLVERSFLNVDEICSFVIKDIVASGVLADKEGCDKWIFHQKHETLLNQVDECISNVLDLEKATSAIYHLMTNTPSGADQVHAAKLCYKYGVKYQKMHSEDPNVQKAFTKIEKKYFSYSVLHILHFYQLNDEKYVNLVSRPDELIMALYHDKRIFKKVDSIHSHCPDINLATDEISKLFKMDVHKIRIDLVKNWLNDNANYASDFDTSLIGNPNATVDYCDRAEDNLKRAAYVCSSDIMHSFWLPYLFKLGMEVGDKVAVTVKARALKVLASITSVDTLENVANVTYNEIMNFIDKLTLVADLQYLGMSFEIEALDQSNKKEIFKSLALRIGNALSVKAMGMLCMTYTIEDAKYWEFIVNNAIKHSMFSELKTYVKFLKQEKFQNKLFYVNAWQSLLDSKFGLLSGLNGDQLQAALIDNFLMIQSCPVRYSLNFKNSFMKCVQVRKFEFAVLLLQYTKDKNLKQKLLSEIGNIDVLPALDKLAIVGLCGVPVVKSMLENNFM